MVHHGISDPISNGERRPALMAVGGLEAGGEGDNLAEEGTVGQSEVEGVRGPVGEAAITTLAAVKGVRLEKRVQCAVEGGSVLVLPSEP